MRRGASRIGDILPRVLGRAGSGAFRNAEAIAAWNQVVPPEIARHTQARELRGSEFVVDVDSSAWAQELTLLATDLAERLNTAAGKRLVGSVRFNVSRRVGEGRLQVEMARDEDAFYAPEDVEPIPLTPIEEGQIEYLVAQIPDPSLRARAAAAMRKDQELKKGRRKRSAQNDARRP